MISPDTLLQRSARSIAYPHQTMAKCNYGLHLLSGWMGFEASWWWSIDYQSMPPSWWHLPTAPRKRPHACFKYWGLPLGPFTLYAPLKQTSARYPAFPRKTPEMTSKTAIRCDCFRTLGKNRLHPFEIATSFAIRSTTTNHYTLISRN